MLGVLQAQNWEWMRQVRTPYTGGSEGKFIGRDAQNNIYTAGLFSESAAFSDSLTVTSLGGSDIFLAKYGADHRARWVRHIGSLGNQYPGDAVTAMTVDKNGNVYLAGICTGPFAFNTDTVKNVPISIPAAFLVKYLPNGAIGWRQLWNTGRCPAMATDTAGCLYLAVTVAADSVYLRKYAPDSTRLWTKPCLTKEGPFAPPVNAVVNGLTVGDSGEIIIYGRCTGTLLLGGLTDFALRTTSSNDEDGFVAKFNANGIPRWGVVDGLGSSNDNVTAVAVDRSTLYLTGSSGVAGNGIFAAKYTAGGKEVWRTKPLKSTVLDMPAAVCVRRATGGVYVAGHFADTLAFAHTRDVADSFYSEKNNVWSWYVRTVPLDTCLMLAPVFGTNRQSAVFIVWFDSTGKYTGHFQNNTSGGEELRQAVMDENGQLYATGFSRGGAPFGPDTLQSPSSAGDCFTGGFSSAAAPPAQVRDEVRAAQPDLSIHNIPNPLGAGTTIRFTVPEKSPVLLQVVNNDGKRVAVIENRVMPAGSYAVKFDSSKLANGTYQCWLSAGEQMVVRQLIVVK
jgi:hypothetical protein